MRRAHTRLSRAATACVATMAVLHAVAALTERGAPAYAQVVALVACMASSTAALLLVRTNSFAARLGVVTVCLLSAGGAVLVGTAGLPGPVPSTFSGTASGVFVLAVATVLLLALDARTDRSTDAPVRPPYAL